MSVGQFVLKSTFNGVDMVRNVFTVDASGGVSPDINDAPLYMDQLYTPTVLSMITSRWSTTTIALELPDGAGHWAFHDEIAYVKHGTSILDALPQQVAAVIIGITASRRRGKKFIAGLTVETQADGVLTDTSIAILQGWANAYAHPDTSSFAHAFEPGVARLSGSTVDFIAFTRGTVDSVLGTQVRRKQGRGA